MYVHRVVLKVGHANVTDLDERDRPDKKKRRKQTNKQTKTATKTIICDLFTSVFRMYSFGR